MSDFNYYIERTCKVCANCDRFELTKNQKAFELFDFNTIWNSRCSKCGSTNCESIGGPAIELDKELMLDWGRDPNLSLMEQDEELLLADGKYVDLMIDILDHEDILANKRKILVEALCIIVYDNLVETEDEESFMYQDPQLLDKVTKALKERIDLLEEACDRVMTYIKEVTYPHLGIYKW
jgi:hypothetical protein